MYNCEPCIAAFICKEDNNSHCCVEFNKLVEEKFTAHNTGSPKLPPEIVESSEPCDYCVDKTHPNCKDQRAEYFPSCFIGRQLRAGT
jgi:hypothetical protein